jgi:cytochrome c553
MIRRIVGVPALALVLSIVSTPAHAKPEWLSAFSSRYPAATELTTCGVCHMNFSPGSTARNPYGVAFKNANGPNNPNSAFAAIENTDSDGDGTSNVDEIDTDAGFYPGWTCATIDSALNKPSGVDDVVDPSDPGCLGVTTTSSVTSTSTSTTTTTLPGNLNCAQPVSSGAAPVASDCLFILNVAVGAQTCTPEACVCDPTGDGSVAATDALLCLNVAVGGGAALNCPCGGGNAVNGEQIYDTECSFCHAAGSYDPVAEFATDLAGQGSQLVNDLSTISSAMNGMTLTDQDIADLAAFLDGL